VFTSEGEFINEWGDLASPSGIAIDWSGSSVYVIEEDANHILRFTSSGSSLGDWGGSGTDPGELNFLSGSTGGIAIDEQGCVYVADVANNRIQKFTNTGQFVTQWGRQGGSPGEFSWPSGVAVGKDSNIYVVDSENYRVQVFTPEGTFVRVWGQRGSGNGQFGISEGWGGPKGIAVSGNGFVYVTDTPADQIEVFDTSGAFVMAWGSRARARPGEFLWPQDVVVTSESALLVSDAGNRRIQRLTFDGQFKDVLYEGSPVGYMTGLDVDTSGNIYVFDFNERRVIKLSATGTLLTRWGEGVSPGDEEDAPDGMFNARCYGPLDLAVGHQGQVYVADTCDGRIQVFDSEGRFLTKWGSEGSGEGQLSYPVGIAVDMDGNVLVVDTGNHRVQKFSSEGTLITSWGNQGDSAGQFNSPLYVAVDSRGYVYIADAGNYRIQVFTSDGQFVAMWGGKGSAEEQFLAPFGIAVDSEGYVYAVDMQLHRLTKFEVYLP